MKYFNFLQAVSWSFVLTCTVLHSLAAHADTGNSCCSSLSSQPPILPPPVPLISVPGTYASATKPQSADAIAQILNTLSIYPFAIDGKDFASLSLVFTEDVTANLSAPLGLLTPLQPMADVIEKTLANVDTQHAYGTQLVELIDVCRARSVSYFSATHFGRGKYAGQVRK